MAPKRGQPCPRIVNAFDNFQNPGEMIHADSFVALLKTFRPEQPRLTAEGVSQYPETGFGEHLIVSACR